MKWLFAVLVALNVIIFGAVVGIQVSKKAGGDQEAQAVSERAHELSLPASALMKKDGAPPERVKSSDAAVKEPAVDETLAPKEKTEEERAAEEKARLEREKKKREEKLKKDAEAKARKAKEQEGTVADADASGQDGQSARCARTASVTMPEDDYHRIKGLLVQWPHAASRRVEQRESAGSGRNVRYTVSAQGDAAVLLEQMAEKGFSGTADGSGITVGTFSDRKAAQAMLSRLEGAGFNARIREQETVDSGGMSVAKMQIFFTRLSDGDIQSVQNVVGKYGKLQRGNCR